MMAPSYFPVSVIILSFFIFILAGFSGCSSTEPISETVDQPRDTTELEALYWARIDSSRMNYTQADVDFMTGMIGHHSQALIMSRLAPENRASRSVQTLASRIINAQSDEIELMQTWLRDRDQPVPEVHIDGLNLMIQGTDANNGPDEHHGHGMHDHNDMPGMLTQDQLEELAEARGRDFDRLFLIFMIEHHEGAVTMVETLFSAEGAALDREAFDLASGINAEQVTEIERMKMMLEEIQDS